MTRRGNAMMIVFAPSVTWSRLSSATICLLAFAVCACEGQPTDIPAVVRNLQISFQQSGIAASYDPMVNDQEIRAVHLLYIRDNQCDQSTSNPLVTAFHPDYEIQINANILQNGSISVPTGPGFPI